jgi:putative addiction module component (TIGR02574 family)
LDEARALAPEDRWLLIEELQASLETDLYEPPAPEADEMAARARDWRAGRVEALPWADVRAALDHEFRP